MIYVYCLGCVKMDSGVLIATSKKQILEETRMFKEKVQKKRDESYAEWLDESEYQKSYRVDPVPFEEAFFTVHTTIISSYPTPRNKKEIVLALEQLAIEVQL